MAEKEGFEPPVPFPAQLISSQSHSATLALLLEFQKCCAGWTRWQARTEDLIFGIFGGAGAFDLFFASDDAVLTLVEADVILELLLSLIAKGFVFGKEEDDVDRGHGLVKLLVELLVELGYVFPDIARFNQGMGPVSGMSGFPIEP